jgi:Holliday junction DNA helicase RuvA
LTRIPGVGKKTAERLLVELKDKVAALGPSPPEAAAPAASRGPEDDLLSALANLGYSRPEAKRAVERALRDDADARFEDQLRHALRVLSGR